MKATATYSVMKWEEASYRDLPPKKKMTKATVEFKLTGEIEGSANVEYLMFYSYSDPADQHKSEAAYVGLIIFEGTVKGKSGTFVIEDHGTFSAGAAKSVLRIADGSGTGALEGIQGTGTYIADANGCSFELDYELS